jgi:hypothetical protein
MNLKEDIIPFGYLFWCFEEDFGGKTYINRLYTHFWSKSSTNIISFYGSDCFGWKQII